MTGAHGFDVRTVYIHHKRGVVRVPLDRDLVLVAIVVDQMERMVHCIFRMVWGGAWEPYRS